MTPRSLFAVSIGIIGVWYLASCVSMLLSIVTGPFASLIVGLALLFIARRVL
jgi:hypothetical protein